MATGEGLYNKDTTQIEPYCERQGETPEHLKDLRADNGIIIERKPEQMIEDLINLESATRTLPEGIIQVIKDPQKILSIPDPKVDADIYRQFWETVGVPAMDLNKTFRRQDLESLGVNKKLQGHLSYSYMIQMGKSTVSTAEIIEAYRHSLASEIFAEESLRYGYRLLQRYHPSLAPNQKTIAIADIGHPESGGYMGVVGDKHLIAVGSPKDPYFNPYDKELIISDELCLVPIHELIHQQQAETHTDIVIGSRGKFPDDEDPRSYHRLPISAIENAHPQRDNTYNGYTLSDAIIEGLAMGVERSIIIRERKRINKDSTPEDISLEDILKGDPYGDGYRMFLLMQRRFSVEKCYQIMMHISEGPLGVLKPTDEKYQQVLAQPIEMLSQN